MRKLIGWSHRSNWHIPAASFLVGAALVLAACAPVPVPIVPITAVPTTATGTSATPLPATAADSAGLKPIDRAALQALVDSTIKEFLVPGAVVLLRTPQGEFAIGSGTTEIGTTTAPTADTHFRIASNTKTMTAALIMLLAQEGKLKAPAG